MIGNIRNRKNHLHLLIWTLLLHWITTPHQAYASFLQSQPNNRSSKQNHASSLTWKAKNTFEKSISRFHHDERRTLFSRTTTVLTNSKNSQTGKNTKSKMVPFIIERLTEPINSSIFREISEMCIDVFFNEETLSTLSSSSSSSPMKGLQLAYLRNAQYSDLRTRVLMYRPPLQYDMFIAREVILKSSPLSSPAPTSASNTIKTKSPFSLFQKKQPQSFATNVIIDDTSTIYNREYLPKPPPNGKSNSSCYVAGELIGFCEISSRRFPLTPKSILEQDDSPTSTNNDNDKNNDSYNNKNDIKNDFDTDTETNITTTPLRPLLTNLAVKESARQSGIGSQLVSTCEDVISTQWDPPNNQELILQVEEDNPMAIAFYQKRGYTIIYSDPSTRRYDTSGLFLRKVRSTKVCMRKTFSKPKRFFWGKLQDKNSINNNNNNRKREKDANKAQQWSMDTFGEGMNDFVNNVRKSIKSNS